MKLKSLILGSVAAAGLSTAGFAADLGVLTSLDVCDELGLSGLTISSDTNCLQITGGVSYEFSWGDYRGTTLIASTLARQARPGATIADGIVNVDAPNFHVIPAVTGVAGTAYDPATGTTVAYSSDPAIAPALPAGYTVVTPEVVASPAVAVPGLQQDWESKVEAWVQFVGTASTDFGPAKAVLKLKQIDQWRVQNEQAAVTGGDHQPFQIDEAYVSVGDSTVIMAGKKSSIANFGDSKAFGFAGLFANNREDGVLFDKDADGSQFAGHVIQITTDLGNGVKAAAGLENLQGTGTAVGVLSYAGSGITAHATGYARGILDGAADAYGVHVGATGTFDAFKIRGAFGVDYNVAAARTVWASLIGAQATFDMFTISADFEALGYTGLNTEYGAGGSIGAKVTDTVSINVGGKWYNDTNLNRQSYHVAAQIVAAVTETLKLTGEVGVWGHDNVATSDYYGKAELAWTPGGSNNFTSSIAAEARQSGAYKVTFKAAKTFQ